MDGNEVSELEAEEAGENVESIEDVIDCWWSPNNISWDDRCRHHQVQHLE